MLVEQHSRDRQVIKTRENLADKKSYIVPLTRFWKEEDSSSLLHTVVKQHLSSIFLLHITLQ